MHVYTFSFSKGITGINMQSDGEREKKSLCSQSRADVERREGKERGERERREGVALPVSLCLPLFCCLAGHL